MAPHFIGRVLCGLIAIGLLTATAFLSSAPSDDLQEAQQKKAKQKAALRPKAGQVPRGPVAMTPEQISLEVLMGIKDKEQTVWAGEVSVSEGKVVSVEVGQGGVKSTVDGARFSVLHRKQQESLLPPLLKVNVTAPLSATVTFKIRQGEFTVKLADLSGSPTSLMNGQAQIERLDPAVRLTGPATEDDFPALAAAPDGTIWLTYVEYQAGPPLVRERWLNREFDTLVTQGNGDRVKLMRFDGKLWHAPVDVADGGLDVWRPTVAITGKGEVCVAWSQKADDDWDIFYRLYTPPRAGGEAGSWQDVVRLTRTRGSDFHVVSATDSAGVVWLAWQGWRGDNFEILAAALADDHPWKTPRVISSSKANDWSPALAADKQGHVYVAWDTYDKGNYDVRCKSLSRAPGEWTIADSARFEARPTIACAADGRLWIAYEEGDEQWGLDYSTEQFKRIGFSNNPGNALYINRSIKVRCLIDGKLQRPAADLEQAFGSGLARNKSLPRIGADQAGGIWLLFRHHPNPLGAGESWNSYYTRYNGRQWSRPRRLAQSDNLLDNRPAIVPFDKGILAVYSSDHRVRTANRDQDDLYATLLRDQSAPMPPELVADLAAPGARVTPVHAAEAEDVARVRAYRLDWKGKRFKLVRGEFHRHTEYTAHRDQDGTLEDSWRYSLDPGRMDWMGNADHDNGAGNEYMWWQIQKISDLFHNPPHFVAAMTYERSNPYPNGHRNVMMPRRGIRPLPRGDLNGTPEKGTPDTKLLYAYLKHFGGICASHTSGTNMGTDWRDNDPVVEPIVEIYQGHRHNYEHLGAPRSATAETHIGGYQPLGTVWHALEKGYRLGFQTSSDHVSTHISYAFTLVEENSRQSIIDAFKERHCYGATDNILLLVRSGEHLMGEIFETNRRPTLSIDVQGTAPIAKVHVIRDNKYVHTSEPKDRKVSLQYTDMEATPGKTSFYYVRVEQADGNLAWASPMWITYK